MMGIFDIFKQKPSTGKVVSDVSFVRSEGFRGFKRFPMVIHGDKQSEENNEKLKDVDLSGAEIRFIPCKTSSGGLFYQVNILDHKIGSIFNDDQVAALKNGSISEMYIKSEMESVVESNGLHDRPRFRLFAKYKEA